MNLSVLKSSWVYAVVILHQIVCSTQATASIESCQIAGAEDIQAVKYTCESMLTDSAINQDGDVAGHIYLQLIKIAYKQQNFVEGETLLTRLASEYPQFLEQPKNRYQWFYEMGKMKIRSEDSRAAILNFEKSFQIAQTLNLIEESAFSLNALGLAYKKNEQHQKSLTAYLESFRYKEILGDQESMANTLMNVGDVYYFLQEYENALNTYSKARKNYLLAEPSLDTSGWQNLAHCYENIGVIHYQLQQYDDSIAAMQEVLNTLQTHATDANKTTAFTYLGMSSVALGHSDQARMYYQSALSEDISHSNNNALLRYHLADFYWQQQNIELAWNYLQEGLQMAPENEQYRHVLPDLYLLKSDILQQQGNFQEAMLSLEKHFELKEKLLTQKFNQSTQNLLHTIEIEQSQYEVQLLEKENQYKAISINRQYWIILSISLLALIAGFYVWHQFKLRRREQQQLMAEIAGHKHKLSKMEDSKYQLKDIYAERNEGVLCTDSGGSVVFYNPAFAALFALRETQAESLKLMDVLPDLAAAVDQLPVDSYDMPKSNRIENFQIKTDTIDRQVNIQVDAIHLLDDYAIFLIDPQENAAFSHEKQDVVALLNKIMCQPELKSHVLPVLKQHLNTEMAEHETVELFRSALVELMQTCVTVWHAHTKTNRVELADTSGIWRVSIDDGRLRTRAMDRYLNIKHLPNNPRWRQVVKTAHFILSEHELSTQNRKQLNLVLERFLHGMKTNWE